MSAGKGCVLRESRFMTHACEGAMKSFKSAIFTAPEKLIRQNLPESAGAGNFSLFSDRKAPFEPLQGSTFVSRMSVRSKLGRFYDTMIDDQPKR